MQGHTLTTIYGRESDLSSICRRSVIPGGTIITASDIIKREESTYGPNVPRKLVLYGSALGTEIFRIGLIATATYGFVSWLR